MDELMTRVADIARRHLPPESSTALSDPDAELTAAGLESLLVVALLVDLEQELSVTFPAELIQWDTFRSVRSISRAVAGLRPAPATGDTTD
ncbi:MULTISPECIES: phosphopantetheine-binding protein [Streptomyces]|uniref:Acyl carrier protein n=2 Tax=Streptomyces TaxID=1883 RepID=A0A101PR38_STRCK|nr:phosphopantetheine-binding protein [Streptomyces corchorusii]KUN16126.1 acyl carrier protein [Streptomyces corchorusii]